MLDTIIKLIEESGASHVNLRVSVSGHKATVIVNTTLKPLPKLDGLSAEFINLRESLSTPLYLTGDKADMDIEAGGAILTIIDELSDSVKKHDNLAEFNQSLNGKQSSTEQAHTGLESSPNATVEKSDNDFIDEDATSL